MQCSAVEWPTVQCSTEQWGVKQAVECEAGWLSITVKVRDSLIGADKKVDPHQSTNLSYTTPQSYTIHHTQTLHQNIQKEILAPQCIVFCTPQCTYILSNQKHLES